MKKYIISTIFLIGLLVVSNGQQVYYLNVDDGLSSRYTHGVEQDLKGLMWFATREGIDRYDGNEFRNYKLHSTVISPSSLGFTISIVCDTADVVWAYTTSGKIFRYNQNTDNFEIMLDLQREIEIYNNELYVHKLFFDRTNTLWIGTNAGTYYARFSGSELKWLYLYNDFIGHSFVESDSDYIWVGTEDGVRSFSLEDSTRKKIEAKDILYNITKGINISTILYDSQNKKLWIGSSDNGLSVFDFNTKKLIDQSKSTPDVPVRSIVKDKYNNILIGFDGAGIRVMDAITLQMKDVWIKDEDNPGGLSDNSVHDIYCDAEDRIWISTWFAGITIIDFKKPKLELIKHMFNINSILASQVNSILKDSDGDIWFATHSGISLLNNSSRRWTYLRDLENSEGIYGYKIMTISEDNRKRIWIGGYGNGLHCYDKKSRKLIDYTSEAGSIYIYNTYYDNNGNMWVGGIASLLTKINMNSNRVSKYNIKNVTVIINKNRDQLWVGTSTGLYILDINSGKVIPYSEFAPELKEVSNDYINCLYQDNTGRLWIGTNGGGVNLYDSVKNHIDVFSTEDGISSNFINGIFPDDNGTVWISTDKGIGCFDPDKKSSINIGFIDNLTNFASYRTSYAKLDSGKFIVGGLIGAVIFTPELIKPYTSKSKLFFNEFRLSYQRVLPGDADSILKLPIDMVSKIRLKYDQNSFSFNFSSINFERTGQLSYKWKLDAFDSDWTPFTSNKTANYTNIPPGDYTFTLRCYSQNFLVFDDERKISITVSPPYWKTNIAILIYFVLLAGFFWMIDRLWHNNLLKKHASDKIKFFVNTAHELRTPVTLIKAPLRDLESDKGITSEGLYYLRIAQSNAEKLSQIVSQVLDFDKADSNKSQLILSSKDLVSYFNEKIDTFQLLAEDQDIRFKYSLPDSEAYAMIDEDKMNKIVNNLFSNAIKYTPHKGSVELNVKVSEKDWTLEVSDTGIGIPRNERKHLFKMYYRADNAINSKKSGSGLGLMLVQNLVRLHGGKIRYTSKEDFGTTFILSFPRKAVFQRNNVQATSPVVNKDSEIQNHNGSNASNAIQVPDIPKSQIKVLIVEDDEELRNYLVHALGKLYHTYSSGDGKLALEMVQNKNFDFVISDVMLPGLRGDELCKRIKSNIESSHIPVILLTALSDKQNTIIGLEAGADCYIPKPFDIDIVNSQISNILKNRQIISESLQKGMSPYSDKIAINNLDKVLMQEILKIVERELANPEFSITNLCRETAMSRTLLYNKIKVHTGLSPNEFIRIVRMNKAMDLLKSGKYTIIEIAGNLGFHDSKYFSTAFKKFFGKSPKHYQTN